MKPLSDLCFRILSAGCAPGCLLGESPAPVLEALHECGRRNWLVPEWLRAGGAH